MSGMKPMPLPEIPEIMAQLPVKYQALAAIGITTGCRITEILSLRRFDLLNREGNLRERISFLKLKSRDSKIRHRKLQIPEKYRHYILRHLREEEERGYDRPDDYVFRGTGGSHLSRRRAYNIFRQVLGEGFGTHWMRKTFAREMFYHFLSQTPGDPMRALELTRRALNHARIDTTVRYLGINESAIDEAQNAVFN